MARVPEKDDLFNTFIKATAAYLLQINPGEAVANWNRLGLLNAENDEWQAYWNDWNTKYQLVVTEKEQGIRNAPHIEDKNKAKEDFTDWVTDPEANKLNRIGASPNVTNQDRAVFHIKLRDDNRTVHTAPIEAQMFFEISPLSGGNLRVRCREDQDSTRASIPDEANALELRWIIGTTAPNSADDCVLNTISTEALFTHNFGTGNTAKKIYAYARWIDVNNKNRAGGWSAMVQTVIV
jgi:hypothetical protein